jgi:hypothetical protein
VTVEDIMEEYHIGPNAATLYAMDFLFSNIEWLTNKIKEVINIKKAQMGGQAVFNHLFIFDLPGQIELYLNSSSTKQVISAVSQLISN